MQSVRENPSFMRRLQAQESPPPWSALTGLGFVVAYVVLLIAGQIVAITLSGSRFDAPSPGALSVGALLGSLVAAGGIVQWARRRLPAPWIDRLRLRSGLRPPVFVIVLIGLGAAWAIDLVGVLLKLKGDDIVPPALSALSGPIGIAWILAAILAVVAQPVAEGLVFAGVLYPALAHTLRNNVLASLVVAIIYAVISAAFLSTGAGTWYAIIQPFLMVLVMSLVRAYTQSTQSAIVARVLFGLFFVLTALISSRSG
jgi:membrane protease YdiL (CAAX protease family)